jgi:hypothetical protein
MICYQVTAQFTFYQYKPVLVSIGIKKPKAKASLVFFALPVGHGLKVRRFFHTEQEAAQYVSYLHKLYKNRMAQNLTLPGGQLLLF